MAQALADGRVTAAERRRLRAHADAATATGLVFLRASYRLQHPHGAKADELLRERVVHKRLLRARLAR